ncbi:Mitochondrial ATPase complex subunit atp10 [Mortierella claussenii]|nr:Mitochondrial ATPase complex subunit atp10 [Mortierella claussenii]
MALFTGRSALQASRALASTSRNCGATPFNPCTRLAWTSQQCKISPRRSESWSGFATSSRHFMQDQSTPTSPTLKDSSLQLSGGAQSGKEGGTDLKPEGTPVEELPLSPYGGRFGVPEQPMSTKSKALAQTNSKKSPFAKAKDGLKNKVHDWTDEKKNLETRKELLHDFQSGYFREFSELSRTGSKLWKGTTNMIAADKALYMPNIIGASLKTSEPVELVDLIRGKISLVAISETRFGEEQIETFMKPFLEKWPMTNKSNSKVQLVELNIQENPLKAGLVRMMIPFVRKTIPQERHANYMLHYKSIKHLKDPLSMQNSYLGYVFLVDSNCKIRWGAHGNATDAELKTLLDSVQRLSERGGGR